ncbi:MAG: hypothetical protein AAGH76_02960 [Pseudomonadota bacterium]
MSLTRGLRVFVLLASLLAGINTAQATACDVDRDADVDRRDLFLILKAFRRHVSDGDPRDADFDGRVTIRDVLICATRCTNRFCAVRSTPPANRPPIANAGDDATTGLFSPVFLDGSGSFDPDDDALTFSWQLVGVPEGSDAMLTSPATATPTFTPDIAGEYIAELVVNDGALDSAPDQIVIVADAPAFVIDRTVETTAVVTPDGGELSLDDGSGTRYTLSVPPNAVSDATEITLSRLQSAELLPPGAQLLAGVGLSPSGLKFQEDATLTIELAPSLRSGLPAIGLLADDDGSDFSLTTLAGNDQRSAALTDSIIEIAVPHFTVAGVIETSDADSLPPPPAGAGAEARNRHRIAVRIAEILAIPIEDGPPSIIDDPEIIVALDDWLNNPVDGVGTIANNLAVSPDINDFAPLEAALGDLRDLILYSAGFLDDSDPSGTFFAFEDAITAAAVGLVDGHFADARNLCATESFEAQLILGDILLLIQSPPWVNDDLSEVFAGENDDNEIFRCPITLTLTPASQTILVGETAVITYTVTWADGTENEFGAGVDFLFTDSGPVDALDSEEYGVIRYTPDAAGTFTITVLANKESETAQVIAELSPLAVSLEPASQTVTVGETATLNYSVSLPGGASGGPGDGLDVSFDLPGGFDSINTDDFGVLRFTPTEVGTSSVVISVRIGEQIAEASAEVIAELADLPPLGSLQIEYSGTETCPVFGSSAVEGSASLSPGAPSVGADGSNNYSIGFNSDGVSATVAISVAPDGQVSSSVVGTGVDSFLFFIPQDNGPSVECRCTENGSGQASGSGSLNPSSGTLSINYSWSATGTISCTGEAQCGTLNDSCTSSGSATLVGS